MCFSIIKTHIGSIYKNQNNNSIDKIIFNDCYVNQFKSNIWQYQQQKHCLGKVLLFVDNFKSDTFLEKEQDSYFKIIILSFNTSSIIRPIDENIIINFKKLFQQKLLH